MSGPLARYLPKAVPAFNLIKKTTEVPLASLTQNMVGAPADSKKIVFLYFSASWCPPCRGFTPVLAEFYEAHAAGKNFEVVFVTWDEEEEDFDGYRAKMPWPAVPFAAGAAREALTKAFNVQSIPTLIGLDAATGDVVTTAARARLPQDPEGKQFPWPDNKL